MALLSDLRDMDLEKQVRLLGSEIASLKKKLAARSSNNLYRDASDAASDYYADLANAVSSVLPGLRKQSRVVGAATSNHPAAVAVVGLLIVGLVASVLFKRRPTREPSEIGPPVRKSTPSRAASQRRATAARAASSRTPSSRTASRTAKSRNAPTGGRKRVDELAKDAAEPKTDQPPDSPKADQPPDSGK